MRYGSNQFWKEGTSKLCLYEQFFRKNLIKAIFKYKEHSRNDLLACLLNYTGALRGDLS
ncbi:hypothetical protein ABEW05_006184 [Botrytis cinerea]